ncbi:hypothetical protein KKA53_03665 [Candidatus Dependentiae bacterium]|nr:hypothetical protein [Candidatus Dependentiae bacterium]
MRLSKNYFFYLIFFGALTQTSNLPALQRRTAGTIKSPTDIATLKTRITQLEAENKTLRSQAGAKTTTAEISPEIIQQIEAIEAKIEKEKEDSKKNAQKLFAIMGQVIGYAKKNIELRREIQALSR